MATQSLKDILSGSSDKSQTQENSQTKRQEVQGSSEQRSDDGKGKPNAHAQQAAAFKGELKALFREGLKDLQNAILPAFPDSQKGVEEPGTPLNPTQQMVTEEVNPPIRAASERSPQKGEAENSNDNQTIDTPKEMSLKEILDAPSPTTPPAEMERERGGRGM